MGWKSDGKGGFEFVGSVVLWLRDFRRWHAEDTRGRPEVTELAYVQYLALSYATLAKGKWEQEFLGKGKARRLDSFIGQTPDGQLKVSLWDMLDFLAENLDGDARMKWSETARLDTKRVFNLT
jgi:hypothetical protein